MNTQQTTVKTKNIKLKDDIYITKQNNKEDIQLFQGDFARLCMAWDEHAQWRISKALQKRVYLVYDTGNWSESIAEACESCTQYLDIFYPGAIYFIYRKRNRVDEEEEVNPLTTIDAKNGRVPITIVR